LPKKAASADAVLALQFSAQVQLQVPQGLKLSSVSTLIAGMKACSTR
jgi:hypothetical protein